MNTNETETVCGLRLLTDVMAPRYYQGEMVIGDPEQRWAAGDDLLIEMRDGVKVVRRLVRVNAICL
jgi:phage repressor protein C with HTH and peptisase S24 domain